MYQFIETICYENSCFQRLELHNQRCNRTRSHFFGSQPDIRLESYLSVPADLKEETLKCTVIYGIDILNIEYVLYQIRPISSLRMIIDDNIDYEFKYANRSKLFQLYQKKGYYDDILIVKNGLITDISYANTIFLHDNIWHSPKYPLLIGTRLQGYLKEGRITLTQIRPEDLSLFSEARIINAMISIENSPVIPIREICF